MRSEDNMSNFGGWLFHCSPARFQLFRAIEDGAPINNWAAKQHRDEITDGDLAGLWVSGGVPGYPTGVYAVGTVRSAVWSGKVDQRYWVGGAPEPGQFVDIDFDRNIFHHPISVDELKSDQDFADALVLRMPRQTTFVLTASEWHAIERRLDKRRPTRTPRLVRHLQSLPPIQAPPGNGRAPHDHRR